MQKHVTIALVFMTGLVAAAMGSPSAQAREPAQIYGPVFAQYKSITDARKKLRNKEKKGQPMSGDEYFAMAQACSYEEAESPSIILTMLSRSKCKDKVGEYFLEAGRRGTPEGFLAASRTEANRHDAFGFAQLAYMLSGNDAALRDDALEQMSDLRSGVTDPVLADSQARQIAQQLVAGGHYSAHRNPAGAKELVGIAPRLDWLNFKNAKRCQWSDEANLIFDNAVGFDERRTFPTIPATVRIPGIAKPVKSRITRPERDAPAYVTYYLDFRGRWNGLTVLGLTDSFMEESEGIDGTGIRFAEPVEVVASALTRAGFIVNPKGGNREQVDKRDSDGNIDGVTTYLARQNGETVFLCDEVFYASYGEP